MHDVMEHPLKQVNFQTYQLVLPRSIGLSVDNPTGTPEERDHSRIQLLQAAVDMLADPSQVELMKYSRYLQLKASEEGVAVAVPVGKP